jgi:hypothetical protein
MRAVEHQVGGVNNGNRLQEASCTSHGEKAKDEVTGHVIYLGANIKITVQ